MTNKIKRYFKEHEEEIKSELLQLGMAVAIGGVIGVALENYMLKQSISKTVRVTKDATFSIFADAAILTRKLDLLESEGKTNTDEYVDKVTKLSYLLGLATGARNTTLVLLDREDLI